MAARLSLYMTRVRFTFRMLEITTHETTYATKYTGIRQQILQRLFAFRRLS